ncbi:MAG: hypothetical protein II819_13755 [Fibrobacter sp.]|nr:hypothetical protein [Fibrobacter sp.]
MACGGDSGSSEPSTAEDSQSAWMYEDLPECNKSIESTVMLVETEHVNYVCTGNQWIPVEETEKKDSDSSSEDSEDEDDLGDCSDENEGEIKESAYSNRMHLDDFKICDDWRWRDATHDERLMREWGSAKDGTIRQGDHIYKYDEVDHRWIPANMSDTLYGLNGCTQSKIGMIAEGKNGYTFVCDNEWSHDYYHNSWEWRYQFDVEAATGVICNYTNISESRIFITMMECLGFGRWRALPDTVYMEPLIDPRDGQIYRTIGIGAQIWMESNLNYESPNSQCYDGSAENCSKYGRLYTWGEAMDSVSTGCGYGDSCSVAGNNRGICPEGWHLPNEDEWYALEESITELGDMSTGTKLKACSGWSDSDGTRGNGDDSYGFNALPSGTWNGKFGESAEYYRVGEETCYWLSNEGDFVYTPTASYEPEMLAYTRLDKAKQARIFTNDVTIVSSVTKSNGCAVRCLKD